MGFAENFLYMFYDRKPTDIERRAIDMDFILHAEHSFNASTFAMRVTVSTLSDMFSGFVTGIGTLKGPLHGGAAGEILAMLDTIKTADNVEKYVKNLLAQHGKVMGFGHRVYKTYDPRARILNKTAMEMCKEKNNMTYYEIAQKLEEVMKREKNLYPNVDFYSAIVYHHLGMPADLNTPIFAIARSAGWIAHCMEQYQNNRIIRPLDLYTGAIDLKYEPMEKRM